MGAKERQEKYLMNPKNKLRVTWNTMMHRCYSEKDQAYHRYGGKGITVDESWHDFENFYNDMGSDYVIGLTIDRKDNSEGYSKENCRWATYYEQSINRSNNHLYEYNGVSKTLSEWESELGISKHTLHSRLYKKKMSIEEAFTTKLLKAGTRKSKVA